MSQISAMLSNMGLGDWVAIIAIIGVFIDFSPIKINPVGWIISRFSGCFNKTIDSKVDSLRTELELEMNSIKQQSDKQLDELRSIVEKITTNEAQRMRYEIIKTSNSITNGIAMPIDTYERVMEIYRQLKRDNMTDGQVDEEIEIVREHYRANHTKGLSYF